MLDDLLQEFDPSKPLEGQLPEIIRLDEFTLNTSTGEVTGKHEAQLSDIQMRYLSIVALMRWANIFEIAKALGVSEDLAEYHLKNLHSLNLLNRHGETYFLEPAEKIFEESRTFFEGGFINTRTGVLSYEGKYAFLTGYQVELLKQIIPGPKFAEDVLKTINSKSRNPYLLNAVLERINRNFSRPLVYYDYLDGKMRISLAQDIHEGLIIANRGAKLEYSFYGNELVQEGSFGDARARLTNSERETFEFLLTQGYIANIDLMNHFNIPETAAKKKMQDLTRKLGFIKRNYYDGTHYYFGELRDILKDKEISLGDLTFNPSTGIIYNDESQILLGTEDGYALEKLLSGLPISKIPLHDAEYRIRKIMEEINKISHVFFLEKSKNQTYLSLSPAFGRDISSEGFLRDYNVELPLWSQVKMPLDIGKISISFEHGKYIYREKSKNLQLSDLEAAYVSLFMMTGTLSLEELEDKFGVSKAGVLSVISGLKNKGIPVFPEYNLEHSIGGYYFDGVRDISDNWVNIDKIYFNQRSGLVRIGKKEVRLNPTERTFLKRMIPTYMEESSVHIREFYQDEPKRVMDMINSKLGITLIACHLDEFFFVTNPADITHNRLNGKFDPTVQLRKQFTLPLVTESYALRFKEGEYCLEDKSNQHRLTEKQAQTAAVAMLLGYFKMEEFTSYFNCSPEDANLKMRTLNSLFPGFIIRSNHRKGGYIFSDGHSEKNLGWLWQQRRESIEKIGDYNINTMTGICEYKGNIFYLTERQEKILNILNFEPSTLEEITSSIIGRVYPSDLKSVLAAIEKMKNLGCEIYQDRSEGKHKTYSLSPIKLKRDTPEFSVSIDLRRIYGQKIEGYGLSLDLDNLVLSQPGEDIQLTYREAQYMVLLMDKGRIGFNEIAQKLGYVNHRHVTSLISNLRHKGLDIRTDRSNYEYFLPSK